MEDKSKLLRTAPIDMAIVRTNFLTWKMKVRSAANGLSAWDEAFPNQPEKSPIGEWIANVGDKLYAQEPIYQEFKQMHSFLHQLAGQIQAVAQIGEKDEARRLLVEFDKICDDFLKLIESYRGVMEAYREQGFSPSHAPNGWRAR